MTLFVVFVQVQRTSLIIRFITKVKSVHKTKIISICRKSKITSGTSIIIMRTDNILYNII